MLHVHRAERADGLVEALRALLAAPLGDPFAAEVVSVPTRGMERWLTQRMSARLGVTPGRADGICANVDFPSPRRLADEAVAAASGFVAEADPWLPERMVWPLLEVVDAALDEPWLAGLAAHVRRGHRFPAVRHLAELFDRYALLRPDMVRSWAGSTPVAAATALPASVRGNGKSTLAHTPRRSDRRWVSHRSMPRVGTESTSEANGSSSGSASRSQSASTSPSARSAR